MRPNELIVSGRPGSFRRVLATIPLLLFVTLAPTSAWSQTPPPLAPRDMAMTMPGTFTFVSVGDIIIKTPISRLADENVQAALRLIREGDVAFGNLEGNLADFRSYRGLLTGSQGRPADLVASAEVAKDLKPMGFDLVNRANNHLFDNELEGMVETSRLLDEVGIVHAGSGRNLDEAAAPAFLETPKGRAALVGMNTPGLSELEHLAATSRTGNLNGKPGLNMLRYSAQIVLTRGQVDALRQIQDELLEYGDRYDNPSSARDLGPDRVTFYGSPPGRDPIFRVFRDRHDPLARASIGGGDRDLLNTSSRLLRRARSRGDRRGRRRMGGSRGAHPQGHRDLPGQAHLLRDGVVRSAVALDPRSPVRDDRLVARPLWYPGG